MSPHATLGPPSGLVWITIDLPKTQFGPQSGIPGKKRSKSATPFSSARIATISIYAAASAGASGPSIS